tara:strand:- start:10685 stop:12001 length:1317 start_codon:yes stop_codon:yes gene_type:complete
MKDEALLQDIKNISAKSKYYEDLYDLLWKVNSYQGNKKSDFENISFGLFNTPCGGFGDIIVCKTFYDYLKEWYPKSRVSICTTAPQKYKDLGIDGNIYRLSDKNGNDDNECIDYDKLVLKKNIKFDVMIAIPIINKTFDIKQFKKLISYANVFNTFSVSEYNGEYPPYTFPIGVGRGNLGLLFNNFKWKQQKLISGPYAIVYIQPSPEWGVHSKYCFLSYLEMICKKYHQKHRRFQVIIPDWISGEMNTNPVFFRKIKDIIINYYKTLSVIEKGKEKEIYYEDKTKKGKSEITFRGDILPQQRDIFISLMKDSINDILVTGDQSLTDILSCCKYKRVWYQIAPWKTGLAYYLTKELPNKYYSSYKTSCGTIQSINTKIDWKNFMKENDFRILGKERMDLLLMGVQQIKKKNPLFIQLLDIIEHSRYLETAQKKINRLK